MNKKGIFFTFAAISLAVILILAFKSLDTKELTTDTEVVEVRILTMNNFIKDVEQDLQKGLRISGFRAFTSMNQYIAGNGSFIPNVHSAFDELIMEGTLEGQSPSLMQGSTFVDWVDKISLEAEKIDILVNFTIISVIINQSDPWKIGIISEVNITLNDTKGTSSWSRSKSIRTEVNIDSFEDPLYISGTSGKVTNTIQASPYQSFAQGSDIGNLMAHANASFYVASQTAPSFLNRLEGDFSNSTYGIESLVNVEGLTSQGLTAMDRSVVDYIYFGSQSTTNHRINGTPDWFKLDDGHLEFYGVQNLTV